MSDVLIYHPETRHQIRVPGDAMPHYRLSGWLLQSEHDENQAALEAQAASGKSDAPAEGEEK